MYVPILNFEPDMRYLLCAYYLAIHQILLIKAIPGIVRYGHDVFLDVQISGLQY